MITLDEARDIRRELERYLKTTEHLDVPDDMAARLREWVIGEPLQTADAIVIPPWRVAKQTSRGVELNWALDLGHESGTRVWFVARVDRIAGGWKVRDVTLMHARRAKPTN